MFFCSAFIFYSCGVEESMVSYDDIYIDNEQMNFEEQNYARQEKREVYQDKKFTHQYNQYREQINNDTTESAVLNDDFTMDDYYDYAYTARLHRFHDIAPIYGYYDDRYTNVYWYDRDFLLWGTSIYYGYRWWWPTYGYYGSWICSPWSLYTGYGNWWGWHNSWYDYAMMGSWYNGYYYGYYGRYPKYYNSHDMNSGFYRPEHEGGRLTRANINSSSIGTKSSGIINRGSSSKSFGEVYNNHYGNNSIARGNNPVVSNHNTTTMENTITRNQKRLQKPISCLDNGTIMRKNSTLNSHIPTINRNSSTTNPNKSTLSRNLDNLQKNNNINQSTQKRTYTPPIQRQQRSSEDYRNTTINRNRNIHRNINTNSSESRRISSPSRNIRSSNANSFSSQSRSSSPSNRTNSTSRGSIRR